jgi:flagellar assembly protein FliH
MSLYSDSQSNWGTIFMGPGPGMEITLERVEAGGPSLAWSAGTEEEYMARVRKKATDTAKGILLAAQAEAESLRTNAHAQGYEEGLAQAQVELEEFRQGMGASVAAVLSAIEGGAERIAVAWREELASLLRLCVETAINHELSEERAALLTGLFDEAVARMEAAQRIAILVSPEDEPAVADMVSAAGDKSGKVFTVRGDASLPPGSLVLESDGSRVDNSLTVRRSLVENILAQLTMPGDTPDEAQRVMEEFSAAQQVAVVETVDLEQICANDLNEVEVETVFEDPQAAAETEVGTQLEQAATETEVADHPEQVVFDALEVTPEAGLEESEPLESEASEEPEFLEELEASEEQASPAPQLETEVALEENAAATLKEAVLGEETVSGEESEDAVVEPSADPFELAQEVLTNKDQQ